MACNWQLEDWPDFRFQMPEFEADLLAFSERAGRVGGLMEGLSDDLEMEAVLDLMVDEAVRSSEIEGETLPRDQVMSSIRNHLDLNHPAVPVRHRLADGAGGLMAAVRKGFADPLDGDGLLAWHRMLLPATPHLRAGSWRTGGDPMQVLSGRIDEPTVHF